MTTLTMYTQCSNTTTRDSADIANGSPKWWQISTILESPRTMWKLSQSPRKPTQGPLGNSGNLWQLSHHCGGKSGRAWGWSCNNDDSKVSMRLQATRQRYTTPSGLQNNKEVNKKQHLSTLWGAETMATAPLPLPPLSPGLQISHLPSRQSWWL